MVDYETQEFSGRYSEGRLGLIQFHVVVSQDLECLGEMSDVELGCGGFYQHVIYVHLHSCAYLLLEHPVHQPLIGSSCILEPERHHTITIGSLRCDERGLLLVVWVHTDLVVAGEGIHKTKEFMAGYGVYDEVYPRQRETVLWTCFVDVSEVDTKLPLAICFFNEYDVGQPLKILYFPNRPYMEEFSTSSLMAFCLSGVKLLFFCLIGLKDGLTFNL